VKDKARIGGLYDPNRERILKLDADLIVFVGSFDALTKLAGDHGIRTLSVRMGTLDEIRASVRSVAGALQCADQAAAVLARFDAGLEEVRERVATLPRRKVYLCTAHRPGDLSKLGTCADDSFLGELLALAGGDNVFADAVGAWPQISKETLIKRAPDVIIELHPAGMGTAPASFDDLRADWGRLGELPAVQRGEIHFLTDDYLFTPSVRAPLTARRLAQVIHPEAFGD
jgi:iron complex transport system substrate-binding protein